MNEKINAKLGFDYLNPPEPLTRDQVKNLIDLLFDHSAHTEHQRDLLLGIFDANCQHPGGSDVIYWPNLAGFHRDLAPDEVLKVAMGEPLE
jgi:hypothetical protein